MESLKELYRIGSGPSSSHTMGPKRAAERFAERCRDVDAYRVTLYGSLAATGKGHLTDVAILSVLEPAAPTRIVWKPEVVLPFHPNGMLFEGLKGDEVVDSWTIYSVGGGALANEASRLETPRSIYPLSTISEIDQLRQRTARPAERAGVRRLRQDTRLHRRRALQVARTGVETRPMPQIFSERLRHFFTFLIIFASVSPPKSGGNRPKQKSIRTDPTNAQRIQTV